MKQIDIDKLAKKIWQAYEQLVKLGYNKYLIRQE